MTKMTSNEFAEKALLAVFFIISLLITSCRSLRQQSEELSPVYMTNRKKVFLLPPALISNQIDKVQHLEGNFGNQNFSLIILFIADEKQIELTLLNAFGSDMGRLFYDGKDVVFESGVFPPGLKGEYIICDIQNAFYKPESLIENYTKAGLVFEETKEDDKTVRIIKDNKKVIEKIILSSHEVSIDNQLRGYSYRLTDEN